MTDKNIRQLNIRIPGSLYDEIADQAKEQMRTVSAQAHWILEYWFQNNPEGDKEMISMIRRHLDEQ